jgi:hypothetical protein
MRRHNQLAIVGAALEALTLSACGSDGEDAAGTNARPTASAGSGSTSNDLVMTGTGTHRGTFAGVPATGTAVRAESMAFYRLLDGQIVEERAQLDMLGLLQQVGAVPAA